LNITEGHEGFSTLAKAPAPIGYKTAQSTTVAASSKTQLTVTQKNQLAAKQKTHAMQIAMKPGQQILMNAFMLYMAGSQLNIFSISITSMAILSPLTSLLTMNQVFGVFGSNVDLQLPKLLFVAMNLAWLALGLYKMSSMRLLPTTSADWTSKIEWKQMMERTSIPPTMPLFVE
jgi:hypothetical protein